MILSGERTLWLSVLQTFMVDAAKIKHLIIPHQLRVDTYKRKAWNELNKELNDENTKMICSYLDLDHNEFVEQVKRVKRSGFYQQAEMFK